MKFMLNVPPSELSFWAAEYDKHYDDSVAEAIGSRVRGAGVLTQNDFLSLAEWKTRRSKSRCRKNPAEYVDEVTRHALASRDARFKIEVLRLLDGVDWATASVVLHFCDREPWPILDVRAFWSLGQTVPPYITFPIWQAYTTYTRALADKYGVSMRTLDRALWGYSKAHQGKLDRR
jgi:hypothetical protein